MAKAIGEREGLALAAIAAGALLFISGSAGAAAPIKTSRSLGGAAAADEYVAGEVVVVFAEGVSREAAAAGVARAGAEVVRFSRVAPSRAVVAVPVGKEDAFVAAYGNAAGVRIVEKNYIWHALWKPNDPYYANQWHFNKPDFIYAEPAWDIERGQAEVVVAVTDTGVAYENYPVPSYERNEVIGGSYALAPDLAGTNFVAGYDFVHDDDHPNDQNGHGTHVSGTIAQTTDNGADVAGLAHGCAIMPIQVLDYTGSGNAADIADGIDFARLNGANVINMSFGGSTWVQVIKEACDAARDAGVVLLAAAGNEGIAMLSYPAAYNSVLAVGAVDYNGELTWYSSYGLGLDVVAPGGDTGVDKNNDGYPDGVLQMTYDQMYDPGPPETLTDVTSFANYYFQGTSMASPHAAALAALIISTGVGNYDDVKRKLLGTATDLGLPGYDLSYGYGLINCEEAVKPGVPSLPAGCGDCGEMTWFGAVVLSASFFASYGSVFLRRRRKR